LKVIEDIRSNLKNGQVMVLVVLDFSQAFGIVIHKLKNLQNYSDETQMLLDLCLNGRTQFVRCGEKESSVGRGDVAFQRAQSLVRFYFFLILGY
jgi:hypothetical protein